MTNQSRPLLVVEDVPNVLELREVTLRFKAYPVITAQSFYAGHRLRLENKLRHKNTQITRTKRLLSSPLPAQKPAFELLLAQSSKDRNEIQPELDDLLKLMDELHIAQ